MKSLRIQFQGQNFHLHPFCAAFWEEENILLIADLHLGKVTHFRNRGIPTPLAAIDANWDRLLALLLDFNPRRVLFLGDLFHSQYNSEWEELEQIMQAFPQIEFELVRGNHDILADEVYQKSRLVLHQEPLLIGNFALSHHPTLEPTDTHYHLAGHVHPGVWLHGQGRQRLRLPCFYFGKKQGLLPAFGVFTGLGEVQCLEGDRVFVVAEDAVLEVS